MHRQFDAGVCLLVQKGLLTVIPFPSGMMIGSAAAAVYLPGATAATWKIVVRNSNVQGDYFNLADLKWLDLAGNPISTSGATHTGSTAQAGAVGNMFDGDPVNTFYQVNPAYDDGVQTPTFFQTVFPGNVTVGGVRMLGYSTFTSRCPALFDVFYNVGAGDVYLFTGVYNGWAAGVSVDFMDPAAGPQTDWIVALQHVQTSLWQQAEAELRASIGGADQANGGTPLSSANFAASGNAIGNLWNGNLADYAGTPSPYYWDWFGYRLTSAMSIAEVAMTSKAGANTTDCITAGTIYAGVGKGFRKRKAFTGLTWPTNPTTNLITIP